MDPLSIPSLSFPGRCNLERSDCQLQLCCSSNCPSAASLHEQIRTPLPPRVGAELRLRPDSEDETVLLSFDGGRAAGWWRRGFASAFVVNYPATTSLFVWPTGVQGGLLPYQSCHAGEASCEASPRQPPMNTRDTTKILFFVMSRPLVCTSRTLFAWLR